MSSTVVMCEPLEIAAAKALRAHYALGRLTGSATAAEFSEGVHEFLVAARGVTQTIARLGKAGETETSERHRAFVRWFGEQVASVLRHPLEAEASGTPSVYVSRLARGSGPPPFREAPRLAHLAAPSKPRPDDFFFEGSDTKPAIVLCADYLEDVTNLLDQARSALERLELV